MEEKDFTMINVSYTKHKLMQFCKYCTRGSCEGCPVYDVLSYLDDPDSDKEASNFV